MFKVVAHASHGAASKRTSLISRVLRLTPEHHSAPEIRAL